VCCGKEECRGQETLAGGWKGKSVNIVRGWRILAGQQRGAKISACYHVGSSQAPSAVGSAALMGQSHLPGSFPDAVRCHRKWQQ